MLGWPTWPKSWKECRMNNNTAASAATMAIAGLGLFILMLLMTTAAPAAICLSKKEARELWPKAHLYWYSKNHCWSNRRGPPSGLRMDPVRSSLAQSKEVVPDARTAENNKKGPRLTSGADANGNAAKIEVKFVDWNEYNEIDAMADTPIYFEPKPFHLWRSIAIIDPYLFADVWTQRIGGK